MSATENQASEARDTGRLEAFSDGVLAIVVTIIVLEIVVPPPASIKPGHSLLEELLHEWPIFLAYLTSFLSVLVIWINHHNIFKQIRRVDQAFLVLNGLLLLFTSLIPFTTALIAEYLLHPESRTAILVYNGVFLLMALAYNRMWFYGVRRLLSPDANPAFVRRTSRAFAMGPFLYLTTLALGAVNTIAGLVANLALAVFYALPSPMNQPETAETLTPTAPPATGTTGD